MKSRVEEGESFESLWRSIIRLFSFLVDEEEIKKIKRLLNEKDENFEDS